MASITVTPANYKQLLTNISGVDFSGSTADYVQVQGGHIILELPCNYQEFEMEVLVQMVQCTSTYSIQPYGGGGSHGVTHPCDGCKYAARFRNTDMTFVKEIHHTENPNGYTSNRVTLPKTFTGLLGRWAKLYFKSVNGQTVNGRTERQLTAKVDDVQVGILDDTGGWACQPTTNTLANCCPPREFGNTGCRKNDEILNLAGPVVSLRTDAGTNNTIYRFKYWKVTDTSITTPPPVDNAPPTINIVSPADNSTINSDSITIKATAADNVNVTSVKAQLDNNNPEVMSYDTVSGNWGLTITGVPEGQHTLTVTAYDAAGNSSIDTAFFQRLYIRTLTTGGDSKLVISSTSITSDKPIEVKP